MTDTAKNTSELTQQEQSPLPGRNNRGLSGSNLQSSYLDKGLKMKAVILAAGYGTRFLKDLQSENEQKLQELIGTPKPLLPVRGFPLISYWIEALKAGQDPIDVFIVTNKMFYSKFKDWAKNYPSVTVISDGTSANEERLGAVSCLQLIIETFKLEDRIIVIGGDTLFYEDFHLQDVLKKYEVLYKGNNESNLVLSYICKDEACLVHLSAQLPPDWMWVLLGEWCGHAP